MLSTAQMLLPAATARVETPIDGVTGVWIKSGTTVISSGMKMTGAVVSTEQSQYVYSRGVASSSILYTNGRLFISNGGIARDCVGHGNVANGLYVLQGGTASGYTLYSGDLTANGSPNPATLIDAVAYNGRQFFQNYATVSNYIMSGGSLDAGAGGAPKRIYEIRVYGGSATIYNNTIVYDLVLHGGGMTVRTNGRVSGATIQSAAPITVSSGGTVTSLTVSSGGSLTVASGGTGSAITVASGGSCIVSSGGLVHDIAVASGGIISPRVGCVLSGVSTDAGLSVYAGMSAYDVVVHGYLYVSGYVSRAQFYSDSSTAGKICLAYVGGVIEDLDIHGPTTVLGAYYNVRVHEWRLTVSSGALASAVTVMSGASLSVRSGGTALAVTSNAGAIITVSAGGYIEYVTP